MNFGKYNIITNQEQLEALDKYLTEGRFSTFSVDTETNGLLFWKNIVIGISLSVDSKQGFYIPFLTWIPDLSSVKVKKIDKTPMEVAENGYFECVWCKKKYSEFLTKSEYQYPVQVIEYLKKWLVKSKVDVIMHNAPFDVLMIESSLGINLQEQVLCDTVLLKHVLDENTSNGLKETAILWSRELGIPVEQEANQEQKEMSRSVLRNGGQWKKRKEKTVWRGDLDLVGKYACADTFLTYGLFEVGVSKLAKEFGEKHLDWFFQDEVMPLCREVIIPMRRRGVRINVPYFVAMYTETEQKMQALEDGIIHGIGDLIADFSVGQSIDEVASKKFLVEEIMREEGLEYPTKVVKGVTNKTLSKPAIQKAYAETGHWLWGYLLGECELPLSEAELFRIKRKIYTERTGKRNRFNIGSTAHLRWLFCKKLDYDQRGLPQTKSATKKNPIASMKAAVLKEFFEKKHDFVKPLLLWKKLEKLQSTYVLPAVKLNNNGYLHMDFVQSGTISGRFACRGGFNLQTLPRAEELDRCFKCNSKDVKVISQIRLVADMQCNKCGHVETDIVCPSAIKKGFIAPEGYKIVNADYSSLEPRCFSFMSGDPKLKEIYLKDLDLYSKIYCDMEDPEGKYSPDPKAPNFLKKVDNAKRTMVKPVVLGIPYGARGPQTAKLMNFKKTIKDKYTGQDKEILDVEKGKAFREKYLNTYPKLREYMELQDAKACAKGFVETIVARRRHFRFTVPVFKLLTKAGMSLEEFLDIPRKDLETQVYNTVLSYIAFKRLTEECKFAPTDKGVPRTWAFVRAMFKNELNNSKNFPIQGLGAHIANRAMLETNREFKAKGLDSLVILQVHDEITCYSKESEIDSTVEILKDCMENNVYAKKVDIPMIAEPIVANNLKEAK